jgi:carboxypeptidase C (cathepsin A)
MSEPESKPVPVQPVDNVVSSRHSVVINGERIEYTALCGTLVLREESLKPDSAGISEGHKPKAEVFFVAYLRDDPRDAAQRPLTFSFNGGPGSSSVWLHLGVLGPRRVQMGDAGALTAPPYQLIDNGESLLDKTDLVFIDPVGTGYSRAVVGEAHKAFHTFTRDIESVGDFVRLFCARHKRWRSPVYLIGESYGTLRAAGVSAYLQERHGLYPRGLMLVSSVLNFQTLSFHAGNDLPYVLYLPTYTATAWYHKRLEGALQRNLAAAVREARDFAEGEYASALLKGARLAVAARKTIARKLARLTGLSAEYCERADLRIENMHFSKELLRERGRTVGRLDSRFSGFDRNGVGGEIEADPSMDAIMGPYGVINDYLRSELRYESDLPYDILSFATHGNWTYNEFNDRYVDTSESLRRALVSNPHLNVLVLNGYYDLATPFAASEYTFSHLALPRELQANIQMRYYEAGHMMYVHQPSLAQMKRDLAGFVAGDASR